MLKSLVKQTFHQKYRVKHCDDQCAQLEKTPQVSFLYLFPYFDYMKFLLMLSCLYKK